MHPLIQKARRRARLANMASDADRAFGHALEARYGWKGEELPDSMVEVIDYGNAPSFEITLKWLDEQMETIGLKPKPLPSFKGRRTAGRIQI